MLLADHVLLDGESIGLASHSSEELVVARSEAGLLLPEDTLGSACLLERSDEDVELCLVETLVTVGISSGELLGHHVDHLGAGGLIVLHVLLPSLDSGLGLSRAVSLEVVGGLDSDGLHLLLELGGHVDCHCVFGFVWFQIYLF